MRFITLLLLAVTIAATANARCRGKDLYKKESAAFRAAVQKATAKHPFSKGRYWEVSKNGKTSWIIGTIHLEDNRTKDVPSFFAKKIRNARLLQKEVTATLGYEIHLAGQALREKRKNKQHAPVKSYFSDAEWKLIVSFARKKGISAAELVKHTPESIRNILASPACSSKRYYYLDKKVEWAARKIGVAVQPLDSLNSLVNLEYKQHFNDNFYIAVAKSLLPKLKHSADGIETTVQMYRRDETMLIWEYHLADARRSLPPSVVSKIHRETYGMLIIDRNRLWMRNILPQVAKGNVVIAVGAMHLPGKHGLIYQLHQKGFSVKRLKL